MDPGPHDEAPVFCSHFLNLLLKIKGLVFHYFETIGRHTKTSIVFVSVLEEPQTLLFYKKLGENKQLEIIVPFT